MRGKMRKQEIGYFMATQELKTISQNPSLLPNNSNNDHSLTVLTTSLGLGLGLGFGFFYFFTPQTLKPVSSAIKAADGAIKGTKHLQKLTSPSPSSFLFFSKYLIKFTDKASKHPSFNKISSQNLSLVTKKLKASMAAFNLVRYLQFPPAVGSGFLGIGVLSIGYKFSKNLVRVLEGFVGIQLDSAVRTGFEAVELLVKTAALTRELSRFGNWVRLKRRCGIEDGGNPVETAAKPANVLVRTHDFKFRVCLNYHRNDRFCCYCYDDCSYFGRLGPNYPFCDKDLIVKESLQTCMSELLCLALPVHEQIQPRGRKLQLRDLYY